MKISPDYRLLYAPKAERSLSGTVGPNGRATVTVDEPRLYHGFSLKLGGGLQAQHIDTIKVRYNQLDGFDGTGDFFRARQIWLKGIDSDVTNVLDIDFSEVGMNGPGNDFRTSVNAKQRDANGRVVDDITLEIKFGAGAPATSTVEVYTNVGPAVPFTVNAAGQQVAAGPGVIKRIERVDEGGLKAGFNTLDRLVPPTIGPEHATIRRIWAEVDPAHLAGWEIRNGSQVEYEADTLLSLHRISEAAQVKRTLPTGYTMLFDGLTREADKIDLTTFSKFQIRLNLQAAGATPAPSELRLFTEFEGAL